MSTAQALLAEIDAFLLRHGMNVTAFGKLACNDFNTVQRIRLTGGVGSRRIDRIRKFMDDYEKKIQKALARKRAA